MELPLQHAGAEDEQAHGRAPDRQRFLDPGDERLLRGSAQRQASPPTACG